MALSKTRRIGLSLAALVPLAAACDATTTRTSITCGPYVPTASQGEGTQVAANTPYFHVDYSQNGSRVAVQAHGFAVTPQRGTTLSDVQLTNVAGQPGADFALDRKGEAVSLSQGANKYALSFSNSGVSVRLVGENGAALPDVVISKGSLASVSSKRSNQDLAVEPYGAFATWSMQEPPLKNGQRNQDASFQMHAAPQLNKPARGSFSDAGRTCSITLSKSFR